MPAIQEKIVYETATHIGYAEDVRDVPGAFFASYQARHPKTGEGWQSFKRVALNADVFVKGYYAPVAYSTRELAIAALTTKLDELAAKKARPGKYAQRIAAKSA